MNVSTLAETYPVVFDFGAGLFSGFLVLGVLLAILTPISTVSGVPARLLIDLFYYFLVNTLFRILVLGFSLLVPAIIAVMTFKTVASLCGFLLLEYLISLVYLDSDFGLGITPIKKQHQDGAPNYAHPAELLRKAEKQGLLNPAVPEYLLRNIIFARGRPSQTKPAITYGGLLLRPRIVLAPHFQELYPEELQVPLLLHEIALIRNRASFFFGFITALTVLLDLPPIFRAPRALLKFFSTFASPAHDISCDTYALSTFVPEIVVHTLCATLGDLRKIPTDSRNFHIQTFELIELHGTRERDPAIRARILWASQFCTGGGYLNEASTTQEQQRSKTPRLVLSIVCIFSLILPLYTETKASVLYHTLFQKKIALPHSSLNQETKQDKI
jgi:hypothetical protein